MKPFLLLFAVLLASATSAVTTWLLLRAGSTNPHALATPSIQAHETAESALAARVAVLTRENAELSMRLATLEDRPASGSRAPIEGFVAKSAFESFQAEMRAALAGRALAVTEPEDFMDQVQGALIDIRQQEQFDKVREYQEKRVARLDEDVQKVSEWLELNAYQTEEMRTILSAQYEREDEVRRLWEAGEDPELLGEQKSSDRELFRADTERILTPRQYETFWERFGGSGKD